MKKQYKAALNNIYLDGREYLLVIAHEGRKPVKVFLANMEKRADVLYINPKKFCPPDNKAVVIHDENGWHLILDDEQEYKVMYEGIDRYMLKFKKFKYIREFLNVLIKSLK